MSRLVPVFGTEPGDRVDCWHHFQYLALSDLPVIGEERTDGRPSQA